MTRLAFNFGNALFHFRRTGGPKGFLLRYTLAFGLIGFLFQAAAMAANWPIYEIYLRMFTENDGFAAYVDEMNRRSLRSGMVSLLTLPFGILLWMVFEASSLRRYIRAEGFRIRIGADEGRILIVGLIWVGLFIAAYIGLFIVVLLPLGLGAIGGQSGAMAGGIIGILLMFVYLGVCIWASIRLSPAAALTVRDRQIRFFEAWHVTKGRAGTLFGAWLIMTLAMVVCIVLLYGAAIALGYARIGPLLPALQDGSASSADIIGLVSQPGFWVPFTLLFLVGLFAQSAISHIFGGPAALAAKTDPAWAGRDNYSETFS